ARRSGWNRTSTVSPACRPSAMRCGRGSGPRISSPRRRSGRRWAIERRLFGVCCNTPYYKKEPAMADKPVLSDPITLRLPLDILEDIEKIAETADRSRSWVIVRALKYYLMAEGNDVLQIRKGEEQIARGETV